MAQYKSRGGGVAGALGIYLARGLTLSGLPNDAALSWWFNDFVQENAAATIFGWAPFNSGTGAHVTGLAATSGGVVRVGTGATAGSISSASTVSGVVQSEATTRWYVAKRFRITTAVDAAALLNAGLSNFANNKTVMCGFNGALNATQFVLQYDGNFAGSAQSFGVAVDTAFHVFEMYSLGDSAIRARMDGGAEVSAVQASAPTDSMFLNFQARNGVTAADRRLEMDWFLSMSARI